MAITRALRNGSTKTTPASHSAKAPKPTTQGNPKPAKTPATGKRKKPAAASEPPPPPPPKKVRLQTPEPRDPKARKGTTITPPISRRAEPHTTNAPLITPRGSRIVAYKNEKPTAENEASTSPSSTTNQPRPPPPPATAPPTTTANILSLACAHLIANDHTGKLAPLIAKYPCTVFSPAGLAEECNPFQALCSGIIAQQVSGAAAASIKRKFVGLFHKSEGGDGGQTGAAAAAAEDDDQAFPTPAQVAPCTVPFLRTAGLSERKAEYIKGLAEKFQSGDLSASMLIHASDEEVLEKLIAVRGLGKWSVEMFATFGLKRMDILSTGDLGVQRGMAAWMGRDVGRLKAAKGGKWKYMSEGDMVGLSERFAPYRSVFMWYMWRIEDVDVSSMQQS